MRNSPPFRGGMPAAASSHPRLTQLVELVATQVSREERYIEGDTPGMCVVLQDHRQLLLTEGNVAPARRTDEAIQRASERVTLERGTTGHHRGIRALALGRPRGRAVDALVLV